MDFIGQNKLRTQIQPVQNQNLDIFSILSNFLFCLDIDKISSVPKKAEQLQEKIKFGFTKFTETILKISTNSIVEAKSTTNGDIQYDMQHQNRGVCIILRYDFALDLNLLTNIDKDVNLLEQTIGGTLGFQLVESYANLSWGKVKLLLTRLRRTDYFANDCLVICLVTYIEDEWIYLGEKINLIEFIKLFSGNSKSLDEIPKVFIIHNPFVKKSNKMIDSKLSSLKQIHFPKNSVLFHSLLDKTQNAFYQQQQQSQQIDISLNILNLHQIIEKFSNQYDLFTLFRICTLVIPQNEASRLSSNIHVRTSLRSLLHFKRTDLIASPFRVERNFSLKTNPTIPDISVQNIMIKKKALFYPKTKGKCLILVYEPGELEKYPNGRATPEQIKLVEQTFKSLNFEVKIENNPTDISYDKLRNESNQDHSEYGCFILFLFTNGNQNAVTDREQLVNYFAVHSSLVNKPKILFIQGYQPMLYPRAGDNSNSVQTDNIPKKLIIRKFRIPKYADFMVIYSSHVSSSVESICATFTSENTQLYDLMTLLNMVCHKMANHESKPKLPYINSTLTRLVSLYHHDVHDFNENLFDNSKVTFIIPKGLNRGKCVIFNYEHFIHVKPRTGTQVDVAALVKTFEKLNFDVDTIHHDLTSEETLKQLEYESKQNYSNFECYVLCFLSHGLDNGVLHCKDDIINRADLVDCVTGNPSLNGKPKLLLIQACQGNQFEFGIEANLISFDGIDEKNDDYRTLFPKHQDLFIFSSSYPGHVSIRNDFDGSWFIQTLCHMIDQHGAQYDITTIASMVCRYVAHEKESFQKDVLRKVKQIPFLYTTLTRSIRLA